ncbi:MAG: PEP-CTERM sorting domain-containing protein [Oceanipulchritudo sp.]
MKTKTNSFLVTTLSVCLLASATHAQLVITSGSQSTTIDFDSDVGWAPPSDGVNGDNVFKYKDGFSTGNTRNLIENVGWGWGGSDDQGPSADAWSWSASGLNLGMGSGVRTQFGDYNNNASLGDALGTIAGVSLLDRGGGDYAYGIGDNGGNYEPWRDFTLTLRVQNVSGATISSWNVSLDTWYADTDNSPTDATLSYSVDNVNFTAIDSYTTTNVGTTLTESDLAGSISTAVADGNYLYIQFSNIRPSGGSGAGVIIDNWTVAAVPEPSTMALYAGLLTLGLVLYRRRS